MDDSTRRVFDAQKEIARLVPSPWNRDRFLAALGEWRQRPIQLMPVESTALPYIWDQGRGAPCGLWLETDVVDVIAYTAGTSDFHIDQIVWHEVGHMVLNHNTSSGDLAGLEKLLPGIDPLTVQRVLGRSEFADHQEDEAELFADLMLSSTSRWRMSPPMRFLWGEE